jgi:hypothetical protein
MRRNFVAGDERSSAKKALAKRTAMLLHVTFGSYLIEFLVLNALTDLPSKRH